MAEFRKTVCLDFDGVVHSYKSGWKGYDVIPDPIVDGAIAFMLTMLAAGWDVCIHSSRSYQVDGFLAMQKWLRKEAGSTWYESPDGPGLEDVKFVANKPPAILYIDDRGWKFEGVFPTKEFCENFRSWVQPGFAG